MRAKTKIIAGVAVSVTTVAEALIPLILVSPNTLVHFRWLSILVAVVGIVAIIIYAVVQSKEDKLRRQRDSQIDDVLQRLASQNPQPEAREAESPTLAANDPRVYIDVSQVKHGFQWETTLTLSNHGGDVAHKVQVRNLRLISDDIVFRPVVEALIPNQSADVIPCVESAGTLLRNDLTHPLMHEWNAANKLVPETSHTMQVTYEDFAKHQFHTTFDLIYNAFAHIQTVRQKRSAENRKRILEVRNLEIIRLS